jgi:hypothetical protein
VNENEVGEKHLVMIITNEVFCNRYGYDRQGKKSNFLRHRINTRARAFPVLKYSYIKTAVRAQMGLVTPMYLNAVTPENIG